MTTAQVAVGDADRIVVERDDARAAIVPDTLVCGACRDPEAEPRIIVHESRNPWLAKLVCTTCGALWNAERTKAVPVPTSSRSPVRTA